MATLYLLNPVLSPEVTAIISSFTCFCRTWYITSLSTGVGCHCLFHLITYKYVWNIYMYVFVCVYTHIQTYSVLLCMFLLGLLLMFCFIIDFFFSLCCFFAKLHGLWDLSSPVRDWNQPHQWKFMSSKYCPAREFPIIGFFHLILSWKFFLVSIW